MGSENAPSSEARTGYELFKNADEKASLEARNVLLQYDQVIRLAADWDGSFNLRSEDILELHRLAIKDIYPCAGLYRKWGVTITGSLHKPPESRFVEGFVEEMCERANEWPEGDPTGLSAYLLWRLNWIHPFGGGNGRTARALSYLALSVGFNLEIPGKFTIPEQLINDQNRPTYQDALEDADQSWKEFHVVDVSKMVKLLEYLLEQQLEFLNDLDAIIEPGESD